MLARQRLRRFAIGALEDQTTPWGSACECVGPIAEDCDGKPIDVLDSPAGYIIDRLTNDGEASIGLPAIAVYADEGGAVFDGQNEPCVTSTLTLIVEIYVTAEEDWLAENCADDLQERVMYRLLRQEPVVFDGRVYPSIWNYTPTAIRSRTEREKNDRRVWMRQIEITMTGCDKFIAPPCDDDAPLCVAVYAQPA